jgi:hypothetical protein
MSEKNNYRIHSLLDSTHHNIFAAAYPNRDFTFVFKFCRDLIKYLFDCLSYEMRGSTQTAKDFLNSSSNLPFGGIVIFIDVFDFLYHYLLTWR